MRQSRQVNRPSFDRVCLVPGFTSRSTVLPWYAEEISYSHVVVGSMRWWYDSRWLALWLPFNPIWKPERSWGAIFSDCLSEFKIPPRMREVTPSSLSFSHGRRPRPTRIAPTFHLNQVVRGTLPLRQHVRVAVFTSHAMVIRPLDPVGPTPLLMLSNATFPSTIIKPDLGVFSP